MQGGLEIPCVVNAKLIERKIKKSLQSIWKWFKVWGGGGDKSLKNVTIPNPKPTSDIRTFSKRTEYQSLTRPKFFEVGCWERER